MGGGGGVGVSGEYEDYDKDRSGRPRELPGAGKWSFRELETTVVMP